MVMEECPSISWTILGWTPLVRSRVAQGGLQVDAGYLFVPPPHPLPERPPYGPEPPVQVLPHRLPAGVVDEPGVAVGNGLGHSLPATSLLSLPRTYLRLISPSGVRTSYCPITTPSLT